MLEALLKMSFHLSIKTASEKLDKMVSLAFWPILRASSGFDKSMEIFCLASAGLSKKNPFSPSFITSGIAQLFVDTTAQPQDIASSNDMGMGERVEVFRKT